MQLESRLLQSGARSCTFTCAKKLELWGVHRASISSLQAQPSTEALNTEDTV